MWCLAVSCQVSVQKISVPTGRTHINQTRAFADSSRLQWQSIVAGFMATRFYKICRAYGSHFQLKRVAHTSRPIAYDNAWWSEEDNQNQFVELKWGEQSQNDIVEMKQIVLVLGAAEPLLLLVVHVWYILFLWILLSLSNYVFFKSHRRYIYIYKQHPYKIHVSSQRTRNRINNRSNKSKPKSHKLYKQTAKATKCCRSDKRNKTRPPRGYNKQKKLLTKANNFLNT